jgi:hypothetical protein
MQNNNTLNGVELCIPNYFDHNKTGYLGLYEKLENDPKGIKNNFYKIVHYFKFAPTVETYRENDLSNINANPAQFIRREVPNPSAVLALTQLPFMYVDKSGKVQYKEKDLSISNEYNPYAGKNPASILYAGVHAGELPILTEFEAQRIKNQDFRPLIDQNADPSLFDPTVTNSVCTILALRSHPEYGNGLREFVMVSLGELEYKDENGEIKKLEANQNTQMVEVSVQRNATPLELNDSDENWERVLEISRHDIERINKLVGGADATPESLKAMQVIKTMSAEDKVNLDLLNSMTAEDKAAFEAFKAAKKTQEAEDIKVETKAKK